MKQTRDMDRIQQELQPGVLTQSGFLGPDRRRLVEILEDDRARVARLGLTHDRIADRMAALRAAGARGLGQTVSVPPHFEVRVDSVRGKLPCPFAACGLFGKVNITVRNTRVGREVTFSDLAIHMIRAHGFYQGRGSPFRLDPAELATVLEVPEA